MNKRKREVINYRQGPIRVLSLDPGSRNMGWVRMTFRSRTDYDLDDYGVIDLGGKSSVDRDRCHLLEHAMRDMKASECDHVLVERQFKGRSNVFIYAWILGHVGFDKMVIVNPQCVKRRFGTGTGNYELNKLVVTQVEGMPSFDKINRDKRNHICDAWCDAVYWIDFSGLQ